MKELTRAALRAAYQWGRDNGKGRSDKNFNDFLKTTIAKELQSKAENLPISGVSARLYSLSLNETLRDDMKWGVRTDITRVPGGWIYQPICRHHNGKDEYYAPCFVPFNKEFQNVR